MNLINSLRNRVQVISLVSGVDEGWEEPSMACLQGHSLLTIYELIYLPPFLHV